MEENKNSGLKNHDVINELLTSGSSAIDTKNQAGVYMFEDYNSKDGVIYDSVTRPKYNENELEKVVNTNIIELLPKDMTEYQATVVKELFDAKLAENELLTLQNEELRNQLNVAEAAISGLENTLENALVDLDQKDLLLAAAENQTKQTNEKVASTVKELQNAIQRATAESIERARLAAVNAALMDQIKSFKKQVDTSITTINSSNTRIDQLSGANIQKEKALADQQGAINNLVSKINFVNSGKGISIICTLLYNNGYMPEHIWQADQRYGKHIIKTNRPLLIGYLLWARYVVEWFNNKPQYLKYLYLLVKPWSEHMAYEMGVLPKDNIMGNIIHKIGSQYSLLTYNYHNFKMKYFNKSQFAI